LLVLQQAALGLDSPHLIAIAPFLEPGGSSMITSPTGLETVNVGGSGPQTETISLVQIRDAVGYMKAVPALRGKLTLPGAVHPDTMEITDLPQTAGLEGAEVTGGGLPAGARVTGVKTPFVPATGTAKAKPGTVTFSVPAPKAPHGAATGSTGATGAATSPTGATAPVPGSPQAAGLAAATAGQPRMPPPTFSPADTASWLAGWDSFGKPVPASTAGPTGATGSTGATGAAPPPPKTVALEFLLPQHPINMPDGVSRLILMPEEPFDELAIGLPKNPVDGQLAFITSWAPIGDLHIDAGKGHHIDDGVPVDKTAKDAKPAPRKIAAGVGIGFLYCAPDKTWERIA
jgi:hypothetical protein